MGAQDRLYQVAILGGGPAGLGPLVCAAQRGLLDALLHTGVAVIEKRPGLGAGTLGRFLVNSDSHPGAFLECLETPSGGRFFAPVQHLAVTRRLQQQRSTHAPLRDVASYLDSLGSVIERRLATPGNSRFLGSSEARSIHLGNSGVLCVRSRSTTTGVEEELHARAVIVALGGYQPQFSPAALAPGLTIRASEVRRLMGSDELLTEAGLKTAARAGAPVVILGSSHSAFSCAWALLHGAPPQRRPQFGEGDICIVQRSPVRVFYPSQEAAREDGYCDFTDRDICPVTRRVHRLGGLRGDGRELGRQLLGLGNQPAERRVRLVPLATSSPAELGQLIRRAALVVPAFGYRPRLVPIFGPDRRPIHLGASESGTAPLVDSRCRVVDRHGQVVPGVYAVGLGSGFLPSGAMGGEPSFRGHTSGVWLYQNDIGALILKQVAQAVDREYVVHDRS